MTGDNRKELFELVDLLCEGAASPEQSARLERLVLNDPAARKVYFDLLEVHGLLAWDIAVAACVPSDLAETLSDPPNDSGRLDVVRRAPARLKVAAVSIAAAAVVLLGAVLWMVPANQGHPQQARRVPDGKLPRQAEVRDVPPVSLPDVSLPDRSLAEGTVTTPAQPAPTGRLLSDYSDARIVAFINDQVASVWQEMGVRPAPDADDTEWVRRTYLDLIGRIPRADEALAFLKHSQGSGGDRQLVEKLLGSREHDRHLATVWLNLLVGRSSERNIDRQALFAFLTDQFQQNRPWIDTVSELIAARGSSSENGATNFLLAHLNNQAVPATAIVSRLFLGEQLQCVQCHAHPEVKEWGQERFWEFNAFFQQCQAVTRTIVDQETGERTRYRELVDRPRGGPTYYETLQGVMKVSYPKFAGVEIDPRSQVVRREALARLLSSADQPQLARAFVNRVWEQMFGRGLTPITDDMGPHHPPWHPELLDGLAEAFAASGYDVDALIRWICLSRPYRLSSRITAENAIDDPQRGEMPLFSRMYLKRLSVEQLYDSLMVAAGMVSPVRRQDDLLDPDRERFVQQFFTSIETEENGEDSTFDGSLPQALTMINGPQIQSALRGEQQTPLHEILSGTDSETEKIRKICLLVLSRYPSSEELNAVRQVLRRHVKSRTEQNVPPRVAVQEGLRDLYWAYLNSSEFSVNH